MITVTEKLPKELLISESDIVLQPSCESFNTISPTQFRSVLAQTHKIFSPFNQYSSVTEVGRVGKFQFDSKTLQNLGYLKKGTVEKFQSLPNSSAQAVNNDSNWTGINQCGSLQLFLDNQGEQESAIFKLYNINFNWLTNNTSFFINLSQDEQIGFLFVSYVDSLQSAVELFNFFNGKNSDGNKLVGKYQLSAYFRAGVDASKFGKSVNLA